MYERSLLWELNWQEAQRQKEFIQKIKEIVDEYIGEMGIRLNFEFGIVVQVIEHLLSNK